MPYDGKIYTMTVMCISCRFLLTDLKLTDARRQQPIPYKIDPIRYMKVYHKIVKSEGIGYKYINRFVTATLT